MNFADPSVLDQEYTTPDRVSRSMEPPFRLAPLAMMLSDRPNFSLRSMRFAIRSSFALAQVVSPLALLLL